MAHRDYRENAGVLAAWTIAAGAYCIVLYGKHSLTGHPLIDGLIGMVLGLYICSYPAGNMIDIIFYRQNLSRARSSGWIGVAWVSLNVVALGVAWMMVTIGVLRAALKGG
jgi:hypothetical protein